jgi:hypothetical protein
MMVKKASESISGCPLIVDGAKFSLVNTEAGKKIFVYDDEPGNVEKQITRGLEMIRICGKCLKCKEPILQMHYLEPLLAESREYFGIETNGIIEY